MAWCQIGAIIWSNADLIRWCIYAAIGGEEFKNLYINQVFGSNHFLSFHRHVQCIQFKSEQNIDVMIYFESCLKLPNKYNLIILMQQQLVI